MLLSATASFGGQSSLSEQEVPSLQEDTLAAVVKKEDCVVMYYDSSSGDQDEEAKRTYGLTAQQLGDEWMGALLSFQQKEALSLKLFKVDWMKFSADSIDKIRSDTGSRLKRPESPSFVAYIDRGMTMFAMRGPARPDFQASFVNEMLAHSIATVKTDKGEFMRGQGWLFTDTRAKYINVVGVRKDRIPFNGADENVQIVNYESVPYNGVACSYESIYSGTGRLLGIIESCGKNRKAGYFDFDKTGKLQYRVRYPQE